MRVTVVVLGTIDHDVTGSSGARVEQLIVEVSLSGPKVLTGPFSVLDVKSSGGIVLVGYGVDELDILLELVASVSVVVAS